MALLQISAFMAFVAMTAADVNEIVGNNQYLPPNKGYNYDRPQQGFPSSPAPRPTPSYRPPAPSSPSYQPSTPSYRPPAPTPSYRPPQPSYGPPAAPRPTGTGPNLSGAPSGGSGVVVGAGGHDGGHDHDHVHEPGMPYDFEYKVKDDTYGTDYSRNEVSDGDVIRGEYRVQLPDGRLQIVKYTADWKNGFNADVSYQGEAQYPEASNNQNSNAPYPAAGANRPSNSYGPPSSSGSAPVSSYGPPQSGY